MQLSEYIEHLRERLAETGDAPVIFTDETDVDVPDFSTDADSPAYILDYPA